MYEIWVRDAYETIVRGIEVNDLETAKQFFELCKRIEGATLIQIDHNGETLAECYNLRGVWQ